MKAVNTHLHHHIGSATQLADKIVAATPQRRTTGRVEVVWGGVGMRWGSFPVPGRIPSERSPSGVSDDKSSLGQGFDTMRGDLDVSNHPAELWRGSAYFSLSPWGRIQRGLLLVGSSRDMPTHLFRGSYICAGACLQPWRVCSPGSPRKHLNLLRCLPAEHDCQC